MADARALLRAERASRRITHPHASYKSDGKLVCNLCETLVKSEAQWQSHLHSSQHVLRSQRAQEADESRGTKKSLKRKATEDEDEDTDATAKTLKRKVDDVDVESPMAERREKKVKKVAFADEDIVVDGAEAPEDPSNEQNSVGSAAPMPRDPLPEQQDTIDEAEYAAFERDLLALEAEQQAQEQSTARSSYSANATISAPAMSAQELAAQAREEQSAQRGKRDAELEEEREDAARVLEDEFEEMEGLEERVRKLRERREALRRASNEEPTPTAGGEALVNGHREPGGNEEYVDDEDDDEDYDDWTFRES